MYIVSEQARELLADKHILLEVDTITDPDTGHTQKYYCVIEQPSLVDLPVIEHYITAHETLIREYHAQNWDYCISACRGLQGRWNGALDSFYDTLQTRIENILQTKD